MKGILIGFGNMGQTHWERYRHLGVDLSAVVEVDEKKVKLSQSKGLKVYPTLNSIPNIREADFIDICTPTHLHFQHIQEAMRLGKPIFVEKPVVRTREEANQLKKISYPYPIFLGEVEHYNPRLKPFLDYQGRPQKISIRREVNLDFFLEGTTPWFLDEKLSGGIILDLMIHDLDLLVAKYGKPKIKSVQGRSIKYSCLDEAKAVLSFNGFEANLYSSWTVPLKKNPIMTEIEIQDAEGEVIKVSCDDYVIRKETWEQDAFYLELKNFIQAAQKKEVPYSLDIYLDALEIAIELTEKARPLT